MDIRIMQYYLAVVREGTISAAAEFLHVAQPSLSRQMKELEEAAASADPEIDALVLARTEAKKAKNYAEVQQTFF